MSKESRSLPVSAEARAALSEAEPELISTARALRAEASQADDPNRSVELLTEASTRLLGQPVDALYSQLARGGGVPVTLPSHRTAAAADAPRLELAAAALADLGTRLGVLGRFPQAAMVWRVAVEQALLLGPGSVLVKMLAGAALASAEAGQRETARSLRSSVAELCDRLVAGPPRAEIVARTAQARMLVDWGRLSEAESIALQARDRAAGLSDAAEERAEAALVAAWAALLGGRLRRSQTLSAEAERVARLGDREDLLDEASLLEGLALALAGEGQRSRDLIASSHLRLRRRGDVARSARAEICQAMAALESGDWRAARTLAREAGAGRSRAPTLRGLLPTLVAAEAALEGYRQTSLAGPTQYEGEGLLRDGIRLARATERVCQDVQVVAVWAKRVVAELEAEQGLRSAMAAATSLEETLDQAYGEAGPLQAARCLVALARLEERLEGSAASTLYDEARQLAEEAGAESMLRSLEPLSRRLTPGGQAPYEPTADRGLALMLDVSRAIGTTLELDPLLERIMDAIVELLNAERGFLMLYDEPPPPDLPVEERPTLRLRVARNIAREDIDHPEAEVSRSVVSEVQRSGQPIVVTDALNDQRFADKTSVLVLNLQSILCVPLRTTSTEYGLFYVENRSLTRLFGESHVELVMPFAAQAALAIENAFAYRRIQELYEETLSLARARERILNHVSHELKTPIAIVSGSLRILSRKLEDDNQAQRAVERGARNIHRLIDIQRQMLDIYEAKSQGPRETELIEPVRLGPIVERALREAREQDPDRDVEMVTNVEDGVAVEAPREPLRVTLEGLIRNAIENTPDESRVEIEARRGEEGLVLIIVRDFGVGITAESQKHLFEGFYHTQETDRYSSKRPYAFDAGGKGLDLLRTRTFAKRFGWDLELESERCRFIPSEADVCPGRVSACAHCEERKTCLGSGYTEFRLRLPEADSGL